MNSGGIELCRDEEQMLSSPSGPRSKTLTTKCQTGSYTISRRNHRKKPDDTVSDSDFLDKDLEVQTIIDTTAKIDTQDDRELKGSAHLSKWKTRDNPWTGGVCAVY